MGFTEKCKFQLTKFGKIRFIENIRFDAGLNIIIVNHCEKLTIYPVSSIWHVYCKMFYWFLISDEMQPDYFEINCGDIA